MKRLTTIIGVLVLVGAVAVPVMAWGPGWGRGNHMMGNRGNGPEYGRGDSGNLTTDQRSKLEALDRKFYDETGELRDQIRTKSSELDAALNSSDPDLDQAKALQKEISGLRANLDEKTLAYELEARKIVPDQRLGYGYGRSYGSGYGSGGYGPHMGPYGRGMGYGMGYGPGNCWN